jgi:hypothetical protein
MKELANKPLGTASQTSCIITLTSPTEKLGLRYYSRLLVRLVIESVVASQLKTYTVT